MPSPYSYVIHPISGTDYNVPFPYLSRSHVYVYRDGTLLTLTTHYSWLNPTTIRLVSATGSNLEIRRKTSQTSRLVDYQTPDSLSEEDLDTDSLQAFYLAQEALDVTNIAFTSDVDTNWDADNHRIKNVANPVNAQDAATKGYVDNGVASGVAIATAAAVAADASADAALASQTAAGNSASNAASSAGTASTAATTATTKAAEAAASAATATTKASEAAASETVATNAANSANSSATAAGLAANAAEGVWIQFRGVYYGGLASDPSTDPNGNPCTEGDLYFNTTSDVMRVFQSATWVNAVPVGAGVTTFNGRSGNVVSVAGDYNAGHITNTPAGNIAATTVQAAINELDTEKADAAATTSALASKADAAATTSALAGKQASHANLTALSGLTGAADRIAYFTGAGAMAITTFTSAGRALVDDADATAQRGTLGLGTAAVLNVGTSANNVVQLDGTGKLPAVDGSQLTGLASSGQQVRTVSGPTDAITAADDGKAIYYTNAAGCTVTLPSLAGLATPLRVKIINASTGNVTLNRSGSDTFTGGGTAVVIQPYTQFANSKIPMMELYGAVNWVWMTSTRYFRSSDQSISSGGLKTMAHGLGGMPSYWCLKLKCTTAEFGFSVGDEIIVSMNDIFDQALAHNKGGVCYVDATNCYVRFGSGTTPHFKAPRKDTGAEANLTDSKWSAIMEAEF